MKKLILAISGVFCLQFGFIAYHSSDPAAETAFLVVDESATESSLTAKVGQPPILQPMIAELEPEFVEEPLYIDQTETNDSVRPVYAAQTVKHTARKRPALNTFVSENSLEKLQPVNVTYRLHEGVEFKTQAAQPRTEYPRAMPEQTPRIYEFSAKVAKRQKKKGFFAKSLTVIKKPYDWLRAVGSTFKN